MALSVSGSSHQGHLNRSPKCQVILGLAAQIHALQSYSNTTVGNFIEANLHFSGKDSQLVLNLTMFHD